MKEIRKKIPGFNNYVATNTGLIIRIARERFCGHESSRPQNLKEKKLSDRFGQKGYLSVILYNSSGKFSFRNHRAIWIAFNGNIPKGMEINHKNGIKTDNSIDNLELVSRKENMLHASKNNLLKYTKIDLKKREEIKRLYASGINQREIGLIYNVCQQTISDHINS